MNRRVIIIAIIAFLIVLAVVITGAIFLAKRSTSTLSGPQIESNPLAPPPPAGGPTTISPTAVENPFAATPTPTFQNPFQEEGGSYQNPFAP